MQTVEQLKIGISHVVTWAQKRYELHDPVKIIHSLLIIRDGEITPTKLAEAFGCSPSAVTGTVDALEKLHLVARSPYPGDRRKQLLAITRSGRDELDSLAEYLVEQAAESK